MKYERKRRGLVPVVAASWETAGDAGPCERRRAGVVAHVVPLSGAHAAALHVAPTDAEAQARQAANARPVAQAGVVEPRLCYGGCVCEEKRKYKV